MAMIALEVAAGHRLSPRVRVGLAAGLCVSAALNAVALMHYADIRRDDSAVVRAEVGALELARATVASDFRPDSDSERAPSVLAGPLLAALDRLGSSPGTSRARSPQPRNPLERRRTECSWVPGAHDPRRGWIGRAPPRLHPSWGRRSSDLTLPGGIVLKPAAGGEARLKLRRFASSFPDRATAIIAEPAGSR